MYDDPLNPLPVQLLALQILFYVMRSISIYRMARNTRVLFPWLAWLPVLSTFLCAQMGDRARVNRGKTPFIEKGFSVSEIVCLLMSLPGVMLHRMFLVGIVLKLVYWVAWLAAWVFLAIGDYWLFVDFEPGRARLYTVLSVLGLEPFVLFIIRNNVPVGVTGFKCKRQPKYPANFKKGDHL